MPKYDAFIFADYIILASLNIYFNTPITGVFESYLYKDDSVLMTRNVNMRNNVTAEADFSAGLEGLGTFEPGEYYVELYFDGERIASSTVMKVR